MTAIKKIFAVGISITGSLLVAAPAIDFRGVMALGSDVRVALAEGENGATRWMRVGETFCGYDVRAFDVAAETVVLVDGRDEMRLRLKGARVVSRIIAEESGASGTVCRIQENLRQLAVAASHYLRIKPAKTEVTVAELVGPDRLLAVLRPVAGEDYGALRLSRDGSSLSVVTVAGETVTLDAREATVAMACYHLTGEGDSIDRIARATGQSVQRILELNELAEPGSKLRVGRLLRTQ